MNDHTSSGIPAIVVGSGHGLRIHTPGLRAAGFNVVGLVGSDPERTARRAERAGIPGAFTDLHTAIAATGAKAVTVASPPHSHGEMVLTAIAHGCHVLCEKPFARDAAEARQLLDAAQRAGVIHMLGNQFRVLPERIVIARAIAEGAIGKPRLFTLIQHISLMTSGIQWPDWWLDPNAGGGWLGASGSHLIDQAHSWLGRIARLSAVTQVVGEGQTMVEDSYAVRLEMANGVQGIIQQTGAAYGPMAAMIRVVGTEGTLWLDDAGAWLADRQGTRKLDIPDALALPVVEPSDDPRKQFLHIELSPTIRLMEIWRDAITGKCRDAPAVATFADGVACMEVIDAIRRSAQGNGELVSVG